MSSAPLNSLDYALKAAAVRRSRRHRRRVVFLIHSGEIFSAIEPVVTEIQRRSERFELLFFAIPRNYSGRVGECAGLEETYTFLMRKGLSPMALQGRCADDLVTLVRLAPDFIFRQTPWDFHIPKVFASDLLTFSQLCYIPYGLMTVDKPQEQYNQSFHNCCEFIFCESDFHREAYALHRSMGTHGVHVAGYPRFEQFLQELEAPGAIWPLAVPQDMPRILWAPHHSVERSWLAFSTFLQYKDLMLEQARAGRVSILMRPHPALREKLVASGTMGGTDYDLYCQAFDATGTSAVDREKDYIRTFAASDALITDGIGFFSEYLLTGKPLIRTVKAGSSPLNPFGDWLVQACREVHDEAQMRGLFQELDARAYVDAHANARQQRQATLVGLAQGSSARVADALEAA
jgi:hypothetical protein